MQRNKRGQGNKIVHTTEVVGTGKLCADTSIRMEIAEDKAFYLHLWRTKRNGERVGTGFSHPQAIRYYALGLLELADRFETEARPVWESMGGSWLSPEEALKAAQ